MGRTNKARLAVCSKAIVKRECLVFVFFILEQRSAKMAAFFGRDQIYLLFCNFHLNVCCYSVLVFVFVS